MKAVHALACRWVALMLLWLVGAPLGWAQGAGASLPLREATVDALVEQLAPPPEPAVNTVRSLRNLVPQPQAPAAPRQVDLMVHFEFNSAELSEDSRQLLDTLSQALASRRLAASRFRVEGHTDAKGTAAYNQGLSQRRAQAVVTHLAAHGVAPERLQAVGMGFDSLLFKDKPFAAENRRVRIVAME